ncbi:MAG TPA: hypothetical protein VGG58_01065 [Candidatus Acidoferrum sp.]
MHLAKFAGVCAQAAMGAAKQVDNMAEMVKILTRPAKAKTAV